MEKTKIVIDNSMNLDGVKIEIPICDDFSSDLVKYSTLNSEYLDEIKDSKINKIIDYEKAIFYPAYLNRMIYFAKDSSFINSNGLVKVNRSPINKLGINNPTGYTYDLDEYSHDVYKINFNLYLKRREHDEYNDYGSWASSDEYYWNRWDGTRTNTKKEMDNTLSTERNGDLLGCLGFTDEDVFYQKNSLKKSFLRISIYDSPYRQSQKLLYYSTLFFDTNILYKKYVNLNKYKKINDDELRVYQSKYKNGTKDDTIPVEDRLTASFSCSSKNDDSASSDGFYLYLFKTIVNEGKCTQLYMKVEFNNAKYGKTVLLTNPRYKETLYNVKVNNAIIYKNVTLSEAKEKRDEILENTPDTIVKIMAANEIGEQIPLSNDLFPEDYEVTHGEGNNSYVDTRKLYGDMYIPIFVRYNNKKNRFEWYIASNEQITDSGGNKIGSRSENKTENNVININLYEPRINKLKISETNGQNI